MTNDQIKEAREQIAAYSVERRLMQQLLETPSWKFLSGMIGQTVTELRESADRQFLGLAFGEKLDGIQSVVLEGYTKGLRAGMMQVLAVPFNSIKNAEDQIKLLTVKLENEDGGSDTEDSHEPGSGERAFVEPDPDDTSEPIDRANAP